MMPRSAVFTHQTRYKLGSVNDSRTVHWTGSHTRFRTVPAGVNRLLEAPFVQHCSIVEGHSCIFSKVEEGHRMSKCPLQLPNRVETLPSTQVLME